MRSLVNAQVDPVTRARDSGEQRVDEVVLFADDGENRSVVIGVGMDVEQLGRPAKRIRQCSQRCLLAPLGEVRHRFERQRHGRTLGSVKAYYEARAREYDDWVYGTGLFEERDRPGWHEERERMQDAVAAMAAVRTLDIACGTGWLTQHLRGEIVGLDASPSMLEVAADRIPGAEFVVGDALELPFEDGSFERIATGHFYGHLEEPDRVRFLSEARRVATELVVIDSALHDGVEPVEWQERLLNDGSRWEVYKRYFVASELAEELGDGEVLFAGNWFVVVRSRG
jgi:demethylmenaquinone methyltransferase/2-methoxy-6-polyprenyl-1,4-benzoquinol methylase